MKKTVLTVAVASLIAGMALTSAPVSADPIQASKAKTSFSGDGTFRVGKDIRPGTYVSTPSGSISGYWARLSCVNGSLRCIRANDNVDGQTFVTILPTDKYFETTRMGTWRLASKVKPSRPATKFSGDGMYRVGIDIAPGTYMASPSTSLLGYWARLSCATGNLDCILANDNVSGRTYVTIERSDEYFSTSRMGTWKRR